MIIDFQSDYCLKSFDCDVAFVEAGAIGILGSADLTGRGVPSTSRIRQAMKAVNCLLDEAVSFEGPLHAVIVTTHLGWSVACGNRGVVI